MDGLCNQCDWIAYWYFLTEYTEVTFHCETHDWLRPKENLQIACWSLSGLGLLSCILTEVHIRTNPIKEM